MTRFCAKVAALQPHNAARPGKAHGHPWPAYTAIDDVPEKDMAGSKPRPGMSWGASALGVLALVAALFGVVLAGLWWGQEKLLFVPTVLPPDRVLARADDIHETRIAVPGAQLSALHLRLPDPKGVVFFLHGNAGNLESWFVSPDYYRQANYDLFMIDYRGYGKSSGSIDSEAQLHADVRAAWDSIAARYVGRKRVLYGRSLGSGLAARLAVELPGGEAPDLTVLVSPYSSVLALTAQHYPWVPQQLLRYPLRTDALVDRIPNRLLLIHGERDALIGASHSRALQALAPHAQLLLVPGAGHNDLQEFAVYLDGLARALGAL